MEYGFCYILVTKILVIKAWVVRKIPSKVLVQTGNSEVLEFLLSSSSNSNPKAW